MFDDAEKKIARLMAESTTPGESAATLGKIKVSGSRNFVAFGDVNVTINVHHVAAREGTASPPLPPVLVLPNQAAIDRARQLISTKCEELGDPLLYQPFIKALFKADQLEALGLAQLARVEWWLGLRADRPNGQ